MMFSAGAHGAQRFGEASCQEKQKPKSPRVGAQQQKQKFPRKKASPAGLFESSE